MTLGLSVGTTVHAEPPPAEAPAGASPRALSLPATGPAAGSSAKASVSSAEPALVEACDGSRRSATQDVGMLSCRRWTIAWQEGGTPWGLVSADSFDGVIAARERQVGFARQYARFFEVPLDERYTAPSPPICETCERSGAPAGRFGAGQKFGDSAARQALAEAEAKLAAFDAVLDEHLPRLIDAARLAHDPAVSKSARAYAKQLRQAVLSVAKLRLALDNAAVLRSEKAAKDAGAVAAEQAEALASSLDTLRAAVAKEVGKAHAGRYFEEGAPGSERPHLEVDVDGFEVKGVYFIGEAKSTWFEGSVELDGSIMGRSLLAPDGGTLTCAQHSEECGYVYIPSVLRFTERTGADEKVVQTAELWFQRSQWVMAKPFTRPRG